MGITLMEVHALAAAWALMAFILVFRWRGAAQPHDATLRSSLLAIHTEQTMDLRGQRAVLARWAQEALLVLETLDPDDCEDGGERLELLIATGNRLVVAAQLAARRDHVAD